MAGPLHSQQWMPRLWTLLSLACALALVGCAGQGAAGDPYADAAPPPVDAALDGAVAERFGAITGICERLGDEINSDGPSFRQSRFDLPGMPVDADVAGLAAGTRLILDMDNAGGSSRYSEAFVFELLNQCAVAELLATENEIKYEPEGDKTDFLIAAEGIRIGVSVARVMAYPLESPYPEENATPLLEDKLAGILESSATVVAEQAWEKQILGLMAVGEDHGRAIREALAEVPEELRADTIVWLIITDGDDGFIYCDGPCD